MGPAIEVDTDLPVIDCLAIDLLADVERTWASLTHFANANLVCTPAV